MPTTRQQAGSSAYSEEEEFQSPMQEIRGDSHMKQKDSPGSASKEPSSLSKAIAVQMQLSSGMFEQVNALRQLSEQLTNHIINQNQDVKLDITSLINQIPSYSGENSQEIINLIQKIQEIAELKLVNETHLLSSVIMRLQGDLRLWWSKAVIEYPSWSLLKSYLLKSFVSPVSRIQLEETLVRRYQAIDEPFQIYIKDIWSKAQALEAKITESELVLHIWTHANVSTLLKLKHSTMPASIAQFQLLAKQIDEMESLLEAARKREEAFKSELSAEISSLRCAYCKLTGHTINNCGKRPRNNNYQPRIQQKND